MKKLFTYDYIGFNQFVLDKYIINKELEGKNIKELLRLKGFSHSLLKQLKKIPDGITVNGIHQNVVYILKENDVLELNIYDSKEDENEFLEPVDLAVEIIFSGNLRRRFLIWASTIRSSPI